ncbi:hypothetical protein EJD97_023872 [Solanum chilense]|uniref:Uncharacterized protein n=1 Tax=Solanum chilense TaxID=4083 RepID=A0A6N2ARY3_SOLCI|nr:hypothetical protein EJD97_023872 [Solanum chilense]
MKVEEFISYHECGGLLLEIHLVSKYATSLVSIPRYEMSRFVTGVADLVKDEWCTTMLHNNMNLSRLMVYGHSIEHSKHSRITRNLKRGIYDDQNQPMFKKRALNQDAPSAPKVNYERGGCSQGVKTTCDGCKKKHFGTV